jgi:DNA-binding NarL/FixJ family response regulator
MLSVAIYGNSLVLAGIGARLERRTGLQTVTVAPAMPGALEKLSQLRPDVVLLDLGTGQADPVVAFWKAQPELLLIGVDPSRDEMLVLSSHTAQARSMADMVSVIQQEECPARSLRGENQELNHQ